MNIEERVALLEDRLAIREFYDDYLDAFHQRDWARFENFFTPDAHFQISPPFNVNLDGAKNIAQTIGTSVQQYAFIALATAGLHVAVNDDRATVRIDQHETGFGKDSGLATIMTCSDELIRLNGRWYLNSRSVVVKYFDGARLPGNTFSA